MTSVYLNIEVYHFFFFFFLQNPICDLPIQGSPDAWLYDGGNLSVPKQRGASGGFVQCPWSPRPKFYIYVHFNYVEMTVFSLTSLWCSKLWQVAGAASVKIHLCCKPTILCRKFESNLSHFLQINKTIFLTASWWRKGRIWPVNVA